MPQSTFDLKNRVALVTGASRGIGRSIALALAAAGAKVAICARNQQMLDDTCQELTASTGLSQEHIYSKSLDIRDEAGIKRFLEGVAAKLGAPDMLVNNAGIYKTEAVVSQSLESWNEVLEINLTAAMLMCKSVLKPMMEKSWGRIINISSISGRTGEIWGSAYSASKFGMIGLTQSLALEVARDCITVNAVCPGWVATEMAEKQLQDPDWCRLTQSDPAQSVENACLAVPQQRFIQPAEVAELVVFLSSEGAAGITGQAINICGGLSLP